MPARVETSSGAAIVKETHRDVLHEHHQNVIHEHHKNVIHEHHQPIIYEHHQPIIVKEKITEIHQPYIHEKHQDIIHERYKPIIHEQHKEFVHEERQNMQTELKQEAAIKEQIFQAPIIEKLPAEPVIIIQEGAMNAGGMRVTESNVAAPVYLEEKIVKKESIGHKIKHIFD